MNYSYFKRLRHARNSTNREQPGKQNQLRSLKMLEQPIKIRALKLVCISDNWIYRLARAISKQARSYVFDLSAKRAFIIDVFWGIHIEAIVTSSIDISQRLLWLATDAQPKDLCKAYISHEKQTRFCQFFLEEPLKKCCSLFGFAIQERGAIR